MPGTRSGSARSMRRDPVLESRGDQLEQSFDEVGVRVDNDYGVVVLTLELPSHLVGDDMLNQGGFAHAGPRCVEGMSSQTVIAQKDGLGVHAVGVPDVGAFLGGEHGREALADVADNRMGRGVRVGRMPQCGHL